MSKENPCHQAPVLTPSLDEVRRHWGLSVDVHRREARLAGFDRMVEQIRNEAIAWYLNGPDAKEQS